MFCCDQPMILIRMQVTNYGMLYTWQCTKCKKEKQEQCEK